MEPANDILGQVLVVSGGSGYNDLVGATPNAIYVLPVSDNGGSSSGGPSLGDIRSRLVRLAAIAMTHRDDSCLSQPHSREALYTLLMHRLPLEGSSMAIKQEWMDILEGKHKLWRGIDPEKRECVRGFLVQFESDVLHRAHRNFNFRGGSIGNFFLVAMQRFFRSIQSAIFLFSALVGIQPALPDCRILPAINTNRTVTIAALLENGESIVGQCEISHPSVRPTANVQEFISSHVSTRQPSPEATPSASVHNLQQLDVVSPSKAHEQLVSRSIGMQGGASDASSAHSMEEAEFGDDDEDKDEHSDSDNEALGNLAFSKLDESAVLQSPISRTSFANTGIYYVNSFRNEVFPSPNPVYLQALERCRMLVYSCIIPCLALRGIASAIANSPTLEHKVLLLNSSHDRETMGMNGMDFVRAICRSLNDLDKEPGFLLGTGPYPIRKLVTHVVYVRQGSIYVPVDELESLGVKCIPVDAEYPKPRLNEHLLRSALESIALNR
ncbi:hypothetical protein CBS14141_000346 [Malassezia furfur]|nr:hypothetical protein CBS14141_000346 [Malassezia furfur]